MISYFLPLFSALLFCFLNFQEEEVPGISRTDLPGIKIENSRTFPGDALWGYIDGGADIFLEYGFDKLKTQKINFSGETFTLDIYRMNDPEAAFGIFSVSHAPRCKSLDGYPYSCIAPYQVQVVKGQYYISVINEANSEEDQNFSVRLAKILAAKCPGPDFEIPSFLQKEILKTGQKTLKVMKGRLGMENGFPVWSGYFEGLEGYEVALLPADEIGSNINIAIIRLKTTKQVEVFLRNINMDLQIIPGKSTWSGDKKKWMKRTGENTFILVETTGISDTIEAFIKKMTF